MKPKVSTLESKVSTLENRPTAPSPNAYVISSGNTGKHYWRKWSDGFIEQWLNFDTVGTTVTIPIAMTDSNYCVFPMLFAWRDQYNRPCAMTYGVWVLNTTSFSFYVTGEGLNKKRYAFYVAGY